MDTAPHPLDDPPGPRLVTGLVKIGLALKSQAWKDAGPRGLTPTQGQILALLARQPPRDQRLSELADALGVTAPTASDAVRALVEKGYVRKARTTGQGRALALGLTPTGRTAAAEAAGWPDFLLDAVDTLSPVEQRVFLRGLIKMIRALQGRGQIPVSRMCVTCRFFRPYVHTDPERPHHCAFVDAPFGDRALRIECADHEPAPPAQAARTWDRFAATGLPDKRARGP